MNKEKLAELSIVEAGKKLVAGEVSSVELTRACLKNIEAKNDQLNAYVEVFDDVEKQARAADERRARGEAHPLLGIPLAIKDNILIEGRRVSAGSKMLKNYVATYDATVIKKLKSAGAVFLGRTNMDEFAMGSSTETSAFGPSRNPYDPSRVAGGSSGGSSSAVAAHMAIGSLGSETSGSIRQPASHTGLVGLKPTYGAVSRSGLIAMASSLDQIGPITKTVADAEVLFNTIRGLDPLDGTTLPDSAFSTVRRPKVVGVPRAFFAGGVSPDVLKRFEDALSSLRELGYEMRDVELSHAPISLAVYSIISRAEASTNLARFDGTRYGLSAEAKTLGELYANTRGAGFGDEVRRRILVGTYVLSAGYADEYYSKARTLRDLIRADFAQVFGPSGGVDAVVTPMCAAPAFLVGAKADPLAMYAEDIFAAPANLADIPAMSGPMGTVVRDGVSLPVGLNIMAPHGKDESLFSIAEDVESI